MTIPTQQAAFTAVDEFTVGHDRVAFKLASRESAGDVAVVEVSMAPGGGAPMLHRHAPLEIYRVRRGELAFYLADEHGTVTRRVAGPGDVVPIASGLEHTIRNESQAEAVATAVFSPGGPMEDFARAAGQLGGDVDPATVIALAETHGIETTRSIDEALAEAETRRTRGASSASGGYLTLAHFRGVPEELLETYHRYAEVMDGVGGDHGLILNLAARTDEGVLVVNLWPSRDESEAAAQDPRRLGVLARTGITPDEVTHEHHEVERYVLFGRETPPRRGRVWGRVAGTTGPMAAGV